MTTAWLAIALALAPGVHAAEVARVDTSRTTAEIEGARSIELVPIVRPESMSTAVTPEASNGNPLAAVPLSALSATRDRPLFTLTRRPPPAVVIEAPAPKVEPTGSAAPSAPAPPPFVLLGTIVGGTANLAVLRDSTGDRVTRMREGSTDSGWKLTRVDSHAVVLEKADIVATLRLPRVKEEPATIVSGEIGVGQQAAKP